MRREAVKHSIEQCCAHLLEKCCDGGCWVVISNAAEVCYIGLCITNSDAVRTFLRSVVTEVTGSSSGMLPNASAAFFTSSS